MTRDRLELLISFTRPGARLNIDELADVVSDMCSADAEPMSPAESALAFDILCRVYPDVEMHIRRKMAELFCERGDVPRALVSLLANDTIDIARRVIVGSPVLEDEDIVGVIVERSHDHRLAVTERKDISARVCDVLVYLGDEQISLNLLNNPGARLSDHGLRRLVAFSRNHEALQEPLLNRSEMRVDLAALMYHWVGEAVRSHIRHVFGEELEDKVRGDLARATGTAFAERVGLPLAPRPAHEQTQASDSVEPLVVALRRGDMLNAETEVGRLTRLPAYAVNRLLYNDLGEGLAVMCRALGFSRPLFSEVLARLHGRPPYDAFARSRRYTHAMDYFGGMAPQQAEAILDGWRKNPMSVWGDPHRFNAGWELRTKQA